MKVWAELRRRRVFRLVGLYIVGAWLVLQVASTFFPAWDIPDSALRYLIIAAILGFPIALVFGWLFDITAEGIIRTENARPGERTDYSLKRTDYLILAALAAVSVVVIYNGYEKVRQTTTTQQMAAEKQPNSIAVLPFINLDDDKDSEYFSDGVTEELLHRLSAFKSLRVLGRTSSFTFKGSELPIPRISDMLQVRYLLQGSVRRDADQVRVTAQLVDDSGFQVWSETFDRKLDGIFSIQTDIANSVATQLVAEIVPREPGRGTTTQNVDAYQEYLIGRDFFNRREPHWQKHASEAYLRSIDLDPTFAPPYAGLAVTTGIGAQNDFYEYRDRLAEAQAHVERALELDPELAEAHAAQGLLLGFGTDANHAASEAALRRALDLDPTMVSAYNWLSIALGNQGKYEEGWQAKQDALEIDPLNPIINGNVAIGYAGKGDFHRAEQLMKRMTELPDPSGTTYWSLHGLYTDYGRMVEANDVAKKLVVLYHGNQNNSGFVALTNNYRYLGLNDEADYWLEKIVAGDQGGVGSFFRKTFALKLQGKYDEMSNLTNTFLEKNPIDHKNLPIFFAEVLGAIKITIGDYEEGIAITEEIIDLDREPANTTGSGLDAVEFMHQLAFAYRQVGRSEKADEVLLKASEYLDFFVRMGVAEHPRYLEMLALNQMMRGDTDSAGASFEKAVQNGWRNYLFVINDMRWGDFFDQPAMKSLMAFVKADLDRQAKLVKEKDQEEDFRAIVEQLDSRGRSEAAVMSQGS